jgi:hypothetical protein
MIVFTDYTEQLSCALDDSCVLISTYIHSWLARLVHSCHLMTFSAKLPLQIFVDIYFRWKSRAYVYDRSLVVYGSVKYVTSCHVTGRLSIDFLWWNVLLLCGVCILQVIFVTTVCLFWLKKHRNCNKHRPLRQSTVKAAVQSAHEHVSFLRSSNAMYVLSLMCTTLCLVKSLICNLRSLQLFSELALLPTTVRCFEIFVACTGLL